MLGRMNGGNQFGTENSIGKGNGGIVEAIVANHFEVFVRDMNNETLNEFHSGDGFDNEFVIFMPVVVKGNMGAGIRVNTGSGNDRSAEVTADVFGNDRWITVIGFCVDIEAFTMILVNRRLDMFERRAESVKKSIKKDGTKGTAQERVVKVSDTFPRGNASDGDFGDKNVNVRIPLKAASKGVKDTDKAGSKPFGFIEFTEHVKEDITNGMKEAIEKRTISAEEDAKLFRNGKNAMSVDTLNELKGHRSGALDRIEIAAGWAKSALAAERNEFERTTRRTSVHRTAKGRISTMYHFLDAFENNRAGFQGVLDFFVMI